MSLLSQQIAGGIAEVHSLAASDHSCAILGSSFKPVHGRRSYEKNQSDVGFVERVDSAFDARNEDITGMNVRQAVGRILTFKGGSYIVRSVGEGELTTIFYAEAKNV